MSRLQPCFSGAFALLALGAGCDAVIGLGEEPSGSSSSTGDATSSSTSTSTTATTSTADATASSAGGGGAASTSSTGGAGGQSEGGGGEGGASDPAPCGGCETTDESECAAGACVEGVCQRRIYRVPGVVAWNGDGASTVVSNRMGRGMATLPGHFVFTAPRTDGRSIIHIVDRATGAATQRSQPLSLTALAALPPNQVLVAELAAGPTLALMDVTRPDDPFVLPPQDQPPPRMNVLTRRAGRIHGVSRGDDTHDAGHGYRIDGFDTCRVTDERSGGAAIHAEVVDLPAAPELLITDYENPTITRTPLPDGASCTGDTEVLALPALGCAYASAALAGDLFTTATLDGDCGAAVVTRVVVDDDGTPSIAGPQVPAMRTRALAAQGGRLLVGVADGGVHTCTAELECQSLVREDDVGEVHEIDVTPWGAVMLGFVDTGTEMGDAHIVCMLDP